MRSDLRGRPDERRRPQDILERFAILDFEASSLSAGSWPIEVGLSFLEGGDVRTWSSLIRPDPSWDVEDWSPASAAIHGISLEELAVAPDRSSVVQEFHRTLGSRKLVSDAPEFEERWLGRFLGLDPAQCGLTVEFIDHVTLTVLDREQVMTMHDTIRQTEAPHRAGPDTARLAAGWLAALNDAGST